MIELRDYQVGMIDRTREAMRKSKRVVLQAPTGAGKTAVAAWMANASARERKLSTYFLCHRRELLDQTALTFAKVGVPASLIAADYPYDPDCIVQICSVPTLTRRVHKIPHPHFAIWDECHHVPAKSWRKIMETWTEAYQVGLSATPTRLDGKGLKDWFDELVLGPDVDELIREGWLSLYTVYGHPRRPRMEGVKITAGDFNKRELGIVMSDNKIMGDIVDHWRKRAEGLRTLVFAVDIIHSKVLTEFFIEAGIRAAHIDGKTPKPQRRSLLRAFAKGEIEVLCNVGLFGEGFDLAANSGLDVTVDCVVVARPTMSLAWWMQMCGRGLRPKADPKQPAIILDHAGNSQRHGLPDEPREWALEDREKVIKEGSSVKECPDCFRTVKPHVMTCPECGYVWVPVPRARPREESGDLVALNRKDTEAQRQTRERVQELKRAVARAMSFEEMFQVGEDFGFHSPLMFAKRNWNVNRKMEELSCKSFRDLVALANRRGMRSPFAWARVVERDMKAMGLM